MPVLFISQYTAFSLPEKNAVRQFILAVIRRENRKAGLLHFIFCNDRFLHSLNKKFLKHNTFTDVITFPEPAKKLSGEIYISIPRVKENAKKYGIPFEKELLRVMLHGILHLCGYSDKTKKQKERMKKKENFYLEKITLQKSP